MKKYIVLSCAFLSIMTLVLALDLRMSTPIRFLRSTTVTINQSHPHPFRLNSVIQSFDTPQTNQFQILMKRGTNAPCVIYNVSSNYYKTASWIVGTGLNFTTNDLLIFTNSVSAWGTVLYNYEM